MILSKKSAAFWDHALGQIRDPQDHAIGNSNHFAKIDFSLPRFPDTDERGAR
jgi:hypothetical protein